MAYNGKPYQSPEMRKVKCPGKDELRPNQRDPRPYVDGAGRDVLKYAQGVMHVQDYGSPSGYVAQAPSSARFTPGMPGEPRRTPKDKTAMTIQPGEPRNR